MDNHVDCDECDVDEGYYYIASGIEVGVLNSDVVDVEFSKKTEK